MYKKLKIGFIMVLSINSPVGLFRPNIEFQKSKCDPLQFFSATSYNNQPFKITKKK